MRQAIWRSALLLSVVLVSCGGSTSGGPTGGDGGTLGEGGGNVTPDEACTAGATSLCTKVNTCAPFISGLLFGDMSVCIQVYKEGCLASLKSGNAAATPTAFQRCTAEVAQGSCADLFSHNPPASCRPSGGPVATGMACGDDWQCASGRCSIPADATCGVCIERAPAGGTCRFADDCDYGLDCASGLCVPFGAAGAMCDASHPCAYGNTCKTGDGGTQGTCGPVASAGQPCAAAGDCGLAEGLFCNPQTRLCQAAVPAQSGEQCGVVGGNIVYCAGAGGRCIMPAGTMTGTCPAIVPPGGACTTSTPCRAGAKCINGICTLSDPSTCR